MLTRMAKSITIISTITVILFAVLFVPQNAKASVFNDVLVNTTKNGDFEIGYRRIDRVYILEAFFDKYNSPLKGSASTFVEVADNYGIDYRLLPSISCMESTCAKNYVVGSYNPFGWGVYGDNHPYFESFDQAIYVVGEGLYDGYISRGFDTVEEIAPIYTPPNADNWASGVRFFINEIDQLAYAF